MKGLIQFLTKHALLFLFVFLLFCSFTLLVKNNHYHGSKAFNSSNFLIGNLYATLNNVTGYFRLKEINENLAQQNAELLSHQIESFHRLKGITVKINKTIYAQKYIYTSAKAINNTTNKRENYMTLDKGSLNGIEPGMGVVDPQGIVGTVKNVSKNFCTVMSVLHEENAVSVKLKKSGYIGSLVWELGNYRIAQLKDIPSHVRLNVGDEIITSGYSMIYPEGIAVGKVVGFELLEGANFLNVAVELAVDYKKVAHVFVVKSWMKKEQKELEALNNVEQL